MNQTATKLDQACTVQSPNWTRRALYSHQTGPGVNQTATKLDQACTVQPPNWTRRALYSNQCGPGVYSHQTESGVHCKATLDQACTTTKLDQVYTGQPHQSKRVLYSQPHWVKSVQPPNWIEVTSTATLDCVYIVQPHWDKCVHH